MAVSAVDLGKMNQKGAEVSAALERTEKDLDDALPFFDALRTTQQDAAVKNLEVLKQRIAVWADETSTGGKRKWALNGRTALGDAYGPSAWIAEGDVYLDEMLGTRRKDGSRGAGLAQKAAETSTAAVLGATAAATVATVGTAARDAAGVLTDPWPLKWKVAAGAAAGLLGLGLLAVVLKEASPLFNLLPGKHKEA